jgi:hypothetical protein
MSMIYRIMDEYNGGKKRWAGTKKEAIAIKKEMQTAYKNETAWVVIEGYKTKKDLLDALNGMN